MRLEERPGLNAQTKSALVAYQKNPTEENKQALLEQMGIRYDKVVARKKAKLRELERQLMHTSKPREPAEASTSGATAGSGHYPDSAKRLSERLIDYPTPSPSPNKGGESKGYLL